MPEGDSVHTLAQLLRPLVTGRTVTCCRTGRLHRRGPPALRATDLAGRTVDCVEARGKHLFIWFDDHSFLRTHLGMTGSWHRYSPGARWQRPQHQLTLAIHFQDLELVCFRALQMEHLRATATRARDFHEQLGPDLAAEDLGLRIDEIVKRSHALLPVDSTAADMLLDQRIASGLGNVYKSELLFLHGIKPHTVAATIDETTRRCLFRMGAQLLRSNIGPAPRRTRHVADDQGPLWV